jgi:radical SAM protein with 4Fe4S-binding SPASM domain
VTTVPFRQKKSAAETAFALRSEEHAPLTAMIEIADRCNEVCVHCYQVQGQRGELETDDWRKILDELAELGVLFLTISGGEATLRADFLEIVAHARKRRFAVKLFTNGLSMTRELAGQLAELAVQEVQISLYSHRAEVHDWVTRVPGSWDKTVNGARFLMEAGVRVVLKSPIMTFNEADVDAYIDFVTGLGADYMLDAQLDAREGADREPEAFRVSDDAYLAARRNPRLDAAPKEKVERPLEANVCGACSGNVHIEANGEIRPCTLLDVAVGHALEDGVKKAWEQNEDAAMIRELTWADLHGCRDCDLHSYCGRCFSNARVEVGDALGPYASACHKARLQFELVHGAPPEIETPEDAARDPRLGPYRDVAQGVFRCSEDVVTDTDRAMAARFGWIRAVAPKATPEQARPGQLVQIRRPGAKKSRVEQVPGAEDRSDLSDVSTCASSASAIDC